MSDAARAALRVWRDFAYGLHVTTDIGEKSWADYIQGKGRTDEEKVVQPLAFPAFAKECLDWTLQANLAPEEYGSEGKPDFTPEDSVTHPFVFEIKGTKDGVDLKGHDHQVEHYLRNGAPRIKNVVLTNLVGVKVYALDNSGRLTLRYSVNLRGLLQGDISSVATSGEAARLAEFLSEFGRKQLTREEKVDRVRSAPEWNPATEVTSSDWTLNRVSRMVDLLTQDVSNQIRAGTLEDPNSVSLDVKASALTELEILARRLGSTDPPKNVEGFQAARLGSAEEKALRQYASHVAYHATTRLLVVRAWEDLGLLEPMLYDGGFDNQMARFDGVISDVVFHSFRRASQRYRTIFETRNSYAWYEPSEETYVDVIYELANTYLGAIESDILGRVYEQLLERIDRKLLGAYYTPRDIISLIWDLIDFDHVAEECEERGGEPRVLDIATGSGGFLVEAARRLRERVASQRDDGASIDMQLWINKAIDGLNGVELDRFSSYLAELNLLVQFGRVMADEPSLRLPVLGILTADTLSLHNVDDLDGDWHDVDVSNALMPGNAERKEKAQRIKAGTHADFLMGLIPNESVVRLARR